jgi:hypothetical protein
LCVKVRVFIDGYGDIPHVKAVCGDVVERRFLPLLDGILEQPNIVAAINFDRKYASGLFAKQPAIQQEQGRRRSTDYCKSGNYTEKKVSVLTDRKGLDNDME